MPILLAYNRTKTETNSLFSAMKNIIPNLSKKRIAIAVGVVTIAIASTLFLYPNTSSSSENTYIEKEVNEAYGEYISAYTTGDISKNSIIRVRFTDKAIADDLIGKEDDRDLFDFSPRLKGTTKWIDSYTVEFSPLEWLESDQVYDCNLDLSLLFNTSKKLSTFDFNFHTYKQDFDVQIGDIVTSAENMKKVSIKGTLNTADIALKKDVKSTHGRTRWQVIKNRMESPRRNRT